MNISFEKTGSNEGSVPVEVELGPTGPSGGDGNPGVSTQAIARRDSRPTLAEVILPRLNLVHSVGLLKDSFPSGAYVFNQELILYTPPQINAKTQTVERAGTPPIITTFLDVRPMRFFQNVKGGGRGLICNTEEEVRAAGGTTVYAEWKLKEKDGILRFDPGCDCLLALERPECVADDGTTFVFEVGDKKYALALYNMKGSAFTSLKKSVNTARLLGCLRDGIAVHSWALSARLEPTPDKTSSYWKPVLTPAKKSTPEFLAWAQGVLAAPTRDSDIAE